MTDQTYTTTTPFVCQHRLPCGYCTMLNKPCSMMPVSIIPNWEWKVTCSYSGVDK